MVLARYYAYGLGKILDGICELNGFTYTSILHVRYIVMSHVGSDRSERIHMHYDFKSNLDKCYTVLIPIDLPYIKEPELVLEMPSKRNEESKHYYYRYKNNVALGFNGGFVHGSNVVGNMHKPRIMLGLFVGNIDDKDRMAKQEIFPNLYGFTKKKCRNDKQLTEWMNGLGKHEKGKDEYLYCLDE